MPIHPDEQSIALTTDFRLLQKRKGHRYSVDDMLVAHLAATHMNEPGRMLDLGCGLGSVLLICAWAFRRARMVGLEALSEQASFARRNLALNGIEDRADILLGDLRDQALLESLGEFQLVTGSPPYFLPGSGTPCADPVRAAAHFELRGGIEEYAKAASQVLSDRGHFVCCAAAKPESRAEEALASAGLTLRYRQRVIPREGKAPFLKLLIGQKGGGGGLEEAQALVLRDHEGKRSAEHKAIRNWTGVTQDPKRTQAVGSTASPPRRTSK